MIVGFKECSFLVECELMPCSGVVKSGIAIDLKIHLATDAASSSHDLMSVFGCAVTVGNHEIDDFADPVRIHETRQKNAGLWKIHLLPNRRFHWSDSKKSSMVLVQKRREDTWGIELGKAAPVDGTVLSNQGYSVEIADDAVVFNGFVVLGFQTSP